MSNYDPRKIPDSIFRLRKGIERLEKRVEGLETIQALLTILGFGLSMALVVSLFT